MSKLKKLARRRLMSWKRWKRYKLAPPQKISTDSVSIGKLEYYALLMAGFMAGYNLGKIDGKKFDKPKH